MRFFVYFENCPKSVICPKNVRVGNFIYKISVEDVNQMSKFVERLMFLFNPVGCMIKKIQGGYFK